MKRRWRPIPLGLAACWLLVAPASAGIDELGRNDIRVYSAPVEVRVGQSVIDLSLAARLEDIGYRRVHRRPKEPGEFFWGHEVFWVHSRRTEAGRGPVGLDLRRADGVIAGVRGASLGGGDVVLTLEPALLAEHLEGRRAQRIPVRFDDLPERVWRPLLAAEDARFFDHPGIDSRAVARALLANVRAGRVAQGGSTITQQLIKMRDLQPKRSLGRKVSEAVRALALEAEYDKRDILEEYLNHVYLGHVDGVALYGYGAAARAFFDSRVVDLDWGQATLLAAIVQSPNRYSPVRNLRVVGERYRWVLERLRELGWATEGDLDRARRRLPAVSGPQPQTTISRSFLAWLVADVERVAPGRAENERGVVIETTLNAWLQRSAERVVDRHLRRIRRAAGGGVEVQAALVALRASTGEVVAYVGGGSDGGSLDRGRLAQRQPGSTLKPLVLAEAFADCGDREPLYPAARVANDAWSMELPTGRWQPRNPDASASGVVTLREATVRSLNLPFVRLAAWCGWRPMARRLERAGVELPEDPPPAFVLGAVEVTPLDLGAAYTAILGDGRRSTPMAWTDLRRPSGRLLAEQRRESRRVMPRDAAFLVRDVLRQVAAEGTARRARVSGLPVMAKTGTSSGERDAWVVGGYGDLVVAVWCGRDDGRRLGLAGGEAAAPLFRDFLERAATGRVIGDPAPPGVELRSYDPRSGLLVRRDRRGAVEDYFVRGNMPPKRRWWRPGRQVEVLN